jgi:hypothetical protein
MTPEYAVTDSTPPDATAADAIPGRRPIVFWGPRNSGKTTYLGRMLLRAGEFDEAANWHVTPADERSADYAADILEMLRREGAVRPTLVTERPFWFKLQHRRRVLGLAQTSEWDLVVLDPKGELFLRNRLRETEDQAVLQLVARSHGLVLLVDPSCDNAAYTYWEMFADNIHEFVMAMRNGPERKRTLDAMNRIRVPTAVCLTKMDRHPGAGEPLAFLRTRLGAAYDLIHRSFTNYQVFPCSALGSESAARPWGLLPPLKWLTEQQKKRFPL